MCSIETSCAIPRAIADMQAAILILHISQEKPPRNCRRRTLRQLHVRRWWGLVEEPRKRPGFNGYQSQLTDNSSHLLVLDGTIVQIIAHFQLRLYSFSPSECPQPLPSSAAWCCFTLLTRSGNGDVCRTSQGRSGQLSRSSGSFGRDFLDGNRQL